MDFLPAALYQTLVDVLPGASIEPIQGQLTPLRAVKSAAEIEKLRAALHLSDLAQAEIRKHIQPGIRELDLWAAVKNRVEGEVGGRVPVLADLVAGVRTAEVGGLPGEYSLQAGDPVMLDFVSRYHGYWGDNCAGYFVGKPHSELEKAAQVVLQALRRGEEAIRPGVRSGDLDALTRAVIHSAGFEPFPHHAGHGLGTTYHEEPRIVPDHPFVLQPGMVLALEPGIYLPGIGGVRFEDAFLVTADGCERLTHHLD
jgi:Xaa-Pro aminopeptidase/Xaa-Pro dipeptidase